MCEYIDCFSLFFPSFLVNFNCSKGGEVATPIITPPPIDQPILYFNNLLAVLKNNKDIYLNVFYIIWVIVFEVQTYLIVCSMGSSGTLQHLHRGKGVCCNSMLLYRRPVPLSFLFFYNKILLPVSFVASNTRINVRKRYIDSAFNGGRHFLIAFWVGRKSFVGRLAPPSSVQNLMKGSSRRFHG